MEELSKLLQTSLGGYSLSRILSALLTLLVCLVAARLQAQSATMTCSSLRESCSMINSFYNM